jgi:ssDNA-binding Zn-finger/Zn-ribbon topoisomerase 1
MKRAQEQAINKKASVKSMDMDDKIELQRREAYVEPQTRDLLRILLQIGDGAEIIPIYSPGVGYVYKVTDKITNETSTLSLDLLENLTSLDILKKSFFDSVSVCPNCQSTIITLHNRCPKCKSHNVEKTNLTEHVPCGYIDQRDKYINDRCPKCGQQLVEGQYRNMGRWFVCGDCTERFENPESDLICRCCNKNFSYKEAQMMEVPKFSLNTVRKREIRQNVASLESIRDILAELDFSTSMPGLAIGQKSQMEHHFSLIGKKKIDDQEIILALDHAISEIEVQASPLILYIYKTSEVKVDIPVFVAIPSMNETARKIAEGHEILLVEGSGEEETLRAFKENVEKRIELKRVEIEEAKKKLEVKPETSFMGKLSGLSLKKKTK